MKALAYPLAGLLLLITPIAAAASVSAGFAPGSLWLSKTEAAAGEAVKVYTVVYNSTDASISGEVDFLADGSSIGTAPFSLTAGESQILSTGWAATAGSHTFSARLANVTGTDALTGTQTNSATIQVAEPAPSPIEQYRNTVTTYIASTSPAAASVIQTIASTTEDWRQKGSDFISAALAAQAASAAASAQPSGPDPEVLGTSTEHIAPSTTASAGSGTLSRIWTMVLRGLLYVFQVQWLFYVALLLVLFIIYKLLRALFAERRHTYHE